MNNTEQYIHKIWTIMPMHTDKEKFYLLDLKKHLKEFMDDHPDCSYEDIVEHFGEPKDIVVEYIQNSDENYLIQRMRLKEVFQKFIVFLCILCTLLAIWFGLLWYDVYRNSKYSGVGEIKYTITDQ